MDADAQAVERVWDLLDENDIDGAQRAVSELLGRDPEWPDALAAQGAVAAARGDTEAALGVLERAARLDPGYAVPLTMAGELHLGLGDTAAAADAFAEAVARVPEFSDGHYGLGQVCAMRGDFGGMVEAWLEARRLDLREPPPPFHLSPDAFERVAAAALAELPPEAFSRLENVPIFAEPVPSEQQVRDGVDPRLLGLFSGIPLPHKSDLGGAVPNLDAIYLFQRNLEREARDRAELEAEIRITLLHETAHFFGLEDDDLDVIGLG